MLMFMPNPVRQHIPATDLHRRAIPTCNSSIARQGNKGETMWAVQGGESSVGLIGVDFCVTIHKQHQGTAHISHHTSSTIEPHQ